MTMHHSSLADGRRLLLLVLCGLVVLVTGGHPVWAQAAKTSKKKAAAGEDKTLVSKMGVAIKITYFRSEAGEEAPVLILLHGKPRKGNRLAWKDFAAKMQGESEFAIITVDLSGHGESGSRTGKQAEGTGKKTESGAFKAAENQAMVADDIETVKRFVFEEHQKKLLNMSKLAIAGADFSTPLAIAFADFDWQKKRFDDAPTFEQQTPRGEDVRALILLSPEEQAPGLTVVQSLKTLKGLGMPVMIGVGKKDKFDKGNARRVYEQLAPKKAVDPEVQRVYLVEYEGQLRGTDLLNQEGLKVELNMQNFLNKHVSSFPVEWHDRRSRLDRDDDDDPKK